MSRQRTVNDQRFWRSPALQDCTTEDKVALLHLLTCPDSNIIGVYALVPRIASAEVGWSQDQWLQVMDRLKVFNLAWYDVKRMFVWVRIWWEHHQATQAMGPKLRGRTFENLRNLPESWLQPFLADFRARLSDELRAALDAGLASAPADEAVSVPYGYPIDTTSNLSHRNANANSNLNLTPTLDRSPPQPVDKSGIPALYREVVDAAIAKAQRAGVAKADAQAVRMAVGKQFKSGRPPRDVGAYSYVLSQSLIPNTEGVLPEAASKAELAAWKGRCFCSPGDNPTHFIRLGDGDFYEQYSLEGGAFRHGYAPLGRGKLLSDLRAGRLREIPAAVFDGIAKDVRP